MTTLIFRSTKLETITYKGHIWFTSSQLAKALEYANPKAVTMIYNKHYDEFTEAMSLVLKTSTNGINNSLRELNTRMFSLRGAHLVAMFARTPVAKEFRKWVLDILDKEAGNPQPTPEAHEKFSSKDTQNLARIIALMTQNFRFRDAWNNAIWYALREVTGIPSPYPMEVRLVPSIASECERIWHVTEELQDVIADAEKTAIKRIIRKRE
ncbi:MAG TPA: Bro-N domain-containing protein, partial [Arsenophonus nasoniae]|uniref:BRO-N domain-containing protein n=2 Tax=Arsenophonus nasoniae TaxID=638 RepID=UPI00387A4273